MLAITTQNGTSLVDTAHLKNPSSSFPTSSSLECFTNVWSPDNSQLYLADSSCIKRYSPSDSLLEELYHGPDTVTCLAMKDKSSRLFFAATNRVWSLDCGHSPGKILSSLEPHKNPIIAISLSNDGALLASVSASAVFIHDLTLLSYAQLKGLPDRKPVACCSFHQHSRTRLLLGIGRDLVVYDVMRPGSPLKTVRIPGGGDIVGVAASPFSKTLIAACTSNGDIVLVDLDKDNGILKAVNVKTSLTCCAFTAEGAAIYLGTESGKLLILDLRSLEKDPKSFTIGDGSAPIKAINVQSKSSSTAGVSSSSQRPASSARTGSTGSAVSGVKSPIRVRVASKIHGGGGVTPKRKLFSLARTPLSENKNLGLGARSASSHSPTLSRQVKPLRLQRGREQEENHEARARSPSPTSRGTFELANTRQRTISTSFHKMGQDAERLGLGPAPESISGHLAAMRVRSGPTMSGGSRGEGNRPINTTCRIISESIESASVARKSRTTSTSSAHNKVSSSKVTSGINKRKPQQQERRADIPDNSDDHLGMSSPELPHEPVTPISLGKNARVAPLASVTCTSNGVLGLTSPEVAEWAKGEGQKVKGNERVVGMKKTRFAQGLDVKDSCEGSDESEDEGNPEILVDGRQEELSLQVSPRRPTVPPTWLQSPHRPPAANLHMNAAAQDFLRNIVHDVMYDFQRETKAEMTNLHLDLVRMGRGWKRDLREMMEEWSVEMQELKAENRRLKEENERLRRGY